MAFAVTLVLGLQAAGEGAAYASDPPPWSGWVSLSTNTETTDANATTATLTAVVSEPLRDSLYVSIYDDTNTRVYCSSFTGLTHYISVAPATNATRTYRAYVAADCPASLAPGIDVRATSGGVTVRNLGYTGTVTVSTNTTQTNANNPTASLTITVTKSIQSPYMLSVYDDLGTRITCTTNSTLTHYVSVTPATNTTRTYTAYVAQDCPTNGSPTNDVKSTSAVTITSVGYDGTLTLTSNTTRTTANNPTASLTITLTKGIPSPYFLSVYDDLGTRLTCTTASGLTHYVSATPATNATRVYTAYVAQDCPTSGQPTNDIKATGSITITNAGYDGTMSMSASTTQTSANSPTATLTISLNKGIPSPYMLSVYDNVGTRITCTTSTALTHYVSVTPATNATRTYTAYVAQNCPTSGLPTNDIKTSTSVTVTNVGWDGTLSISASPAQTSANTPTSSLTISLNKGIASPYSLSVYDNLGTRISCSTSTALTHYVSVTPPTNATRTYTAYVAQGCPSPGPVTNDVKATGTVTITNVGYDGTLTLTSNTTTTDANAPTASLTIALSKGLPTPYSLSVYDDLGTRITCTTYSGLNHYVSVTPPANTTRTYTAYVAQGCPSPGPVTNDVKVTGSITITNVGYNGTITMTTNRSTTNANTTSASLTISLSKGVPSGYHLSVYGTTGSYLMCTTYSGLTHYLTVSPALHSSQTYTAYVGQGCPTTGPPSVAASGAPITITNVGYDGTLTLTSNRTETTAEDPNATLSATLSVPLPSGYSLSIYDDDGVRLLCSTYTTTSYGLTVTPGLDTTRVYTAYVAQTCPLTGSAGGWVDAEDSIGITRADPGGAAIALSVRTWERDEGNGSVRYEVSASGSRLAASDGPCRHDSCSWIVAGYATDPVTGQEELVQTLGSGSMAAGTMGFAETLTAGAATLSAFDTISLTVAGGSVYMAASASVATEIIEGFSAEELALLVGAKVTKDEFCLEVASAPQPRTPTSLGPFGTACEASGSTIEAMIALAALAGGVSVIIWVVNQYHADPTAPAPPVPANPPTESTPTTSVPDVGVITELEPQVELIVTTWLEHKRVRLTSVETMRKAARRCLNQVGFSHVLMARWQQSGDNPCETMPIYFPGSDLGEATTHRADAIYTEHPDWMLGTYEASAIKAKYVARGWYTNEPECVGRQTGESCDEFPNFSSVQGGPAKPGRRRASLRLMPTQDNSNEGSRYSGFLSSCGLQSAVDDSGAGGGDDFLVIPMPGDVVVTAWVCSIPIP